MGFAGAGGCASAKLWSVVFKETKNGPPVPMLRPL
jgi:hypothetical protein